MTFFFTFSNASRRRLSQIGTKWFITDTMADDHNPFAAFAFGESRSIPIANSAPSASRAYLPSKIQSVQHTSRKRKASDTADPLVVTSANTEANDPLCLWSGKPFDKVIREAQQKDRLNDRFASAQKEEEEMEEGLGVARKLLEYELISSFRQNGRYDRGKATVDEFHRFLLALRGEQGRYWALVACLLSVQCLDTVALRAVRALMQRAPRGAEDVAQLTDEELTGVLGCLNYHRSKVKYLRGCTEAVLAESGDAESEDSSGIADRTGVAGEIQRAKVTDDGDRETASESFNDRGDGCRCRRRTPVVPADLQSLKALPGVGPKIANLMLSVAFARDDAGIVVDTHVHRIAHQLGWVTRNRKRRTNGISKLEKSMMSSAAPLWMAKFGGSKNVLSPEQSRIELEKWVPLEKRGSFSLDVIGFAQIVRRSNGENKNDKNSTRTNSQSFHATPTWVENFLQHAEAMEVESSSAYIKQAHAIVRKLGHHSATTGSISSSTSSSFPALNTTTMTSFSSSSVSDWTCKKCTFINSGTTSKFSCSMCGESRVGKRPALAAREKDDNESISALSTTHSTPKLESAIQSKKTPASAVKPSQGHLCTPAFPRRSSPADSDSDFE